MHFCAQIAIYKLFFAKFVLKLNKYQRLLFHYTKNADHLSTVFRILNSSACCMPMHGRKPKKTHMRILCYF